MAEFPALPLWTDSFLADTMHLNAKETGAYLMLIISAWRSPSCCLPNNDKKLSRMARCSLREWATIKGDVLDFWYLENNNWYQKKLLSVRATVKAKSSKAKHAADTKWLKIKDSGHANASLEHMPHLSQPKPKPKLYKKEDTNVSPKENDKEILLLFDEFWKLYPKQRKGNKAKALTAYQKPLSENRATEQEILEGVKNYVGSREVQDGYAKGAAAWLNDDRWTDQPDAGNNQGGQRGQAVPRRYGPPSKSAAYGELLSEVDSDGSPALQGGMQGDFGGNGNFDADS